MLCYICPRWCYLTVAGTPACVSVLVLLSVLYVRKHHLGSMCHEIKACRWSLIRTCFSAPCPIVCSSSVLTMDIGNWSIIGHWKMGNYESKATWDGKPSSLSAEGFLYLPTPQTFHCRRNVGTNPIQNGELRQKATLIPQQASCSLLADNV